MALYKKNEDGSWLKAETVIYTPDGEITRDDLRDGWEYHENDPVEYVVYMDTLNRPSVLPDIIPPYVQI